MMRAHLIGLGEAPAFVDSRVGWIPEAHDPLELWVEYLEACFKRDYCAGRLDLAALEQAMDELLGDPEAARDASLRSTAGGLFSQHLTNAMVGAATFTNQPLFPLPDLDALEQ